MPRSLSPIPASWSADDRIIRYDFLIIFFATGTEYWTNRPGETYTKDIGNGEGMQVWDASYLWDPGQFEQADQDPLSISDVTFYNADFSVTDKMRAQGSFGFRGIRLDAWVCAFDKDDLDDFKGNVPVWSGVMSRAEPVGSEVRIELRPFSDPLSVKFPRRRYIKSHGFNWIPKQGLTIKIGTASHKMPTSKQPNAGGGTPGGGFVPPPGGPSDPTGRGPVVTVPRGGRGTTVPRRVGRDTRKVNR